MDIGFARAAERNPLLSDLIPQDLYLSYPIADFVLSSSNEPTRPLHRCGPTGVRVTATRRCAAPLILAPFTSVSLFLPSFLPSLSPADPRLLGFFFLFSSRTANSTAPANRAAENSLYNLGTQADRVLSRRNRRKRQPSRPRGSPWNNPLINSPKIFLSRQKGGEGEPCFTTRSRRSIPWMNMSHWRTTFDRFIDAARVHLDLPTFIRDVS